MTNLVDSHGRLRVAGSHIVDCRGDRFMLRGASLFWSQWMPRFYNADVVRWLHSDWKANVVRASLAVHHDGYIDHPEREKDKVCTVVDAAISEGIYVIVDWHAYLQERAAAMDFFSEMAQRYGRHPNVIFETWNEPDRHYDWELDIRPYHEDVIAKIRNVALDALVIAGTENFSQGVDKAGRHPIADSNTAYTLHFYAASHRGKLRSRAQQAMLSNIALIATEYGTCEATGGGVIAPAEIMEWWEFLEQNGIGCLNWAISDKTETASALLPGAAVDGGWSLANLTPSGQLVRAYLRSFSQVPDGLPQTACV